MKLSRYLEDRTTLVDNLNERAADVTDAALGKLGSIVDKMVDLEDVAGPNGIRARKSAQACLSKIEHELNAFKNCVESFQRANTSRSE